MEAQHHYHMVCFQNPTVFQNMKHLSWKQHFAMKSNQLQVPFSLHLFKTKNNLIENKPCMDETQKPNGIRNKRKTIVILIIKLCLQQYMRLEDPASQLNINEQIYLSTYQHRCQTQQRGADARGLASELLTDAGLVPGESFKMDKPKRIMWVSTFAGVLHVRHSLLETPRWLVFNFFF